MDDVVALVDDCFLFFFSNNEDLSFLAKGQGVTIFFPGLSTNFKGAAGNSFWFP